MAEWKYDVDEVGPEGVREPEDAEELPVEPGSPRLENVVFFVLGVAFAVGLLFAAV